MGHKRIPVLLRFPNEKFNNVRVLIGFTLIHCDNLEVVATRLQHQRFIDLAGHNSVAIPQLESQRKCHSRPIIILQLDVDRARDPEVTLRPPLVVALQIFPNLFTIHDALVVVFNAIGKKLGFGANVPIESG